ncbi:S-locus glycoprotein [Corchorus olitorius]|uniref:S-locus glycoprotein n=1 Tax=Corchorus olitorius TaxID=93759 RepID=A0A1R3KBV4_9ROSI|nr:S-locus glycoprotein [Corchorus olitorius]
MDILSLTTCFLIVFSKVSNAVDMISPSDSLADGMTLLSNDGSFELGFFTPGTSKNRYLGIWYKNIPMQTVVWVANRINSINDSTGLLKIETTGRVVLQGQNRTTVWSINNSTEGVRNPTLQLLNSGNLVVKDGDSENYLWQSFDYPTDTMLPGMKIGWDLRINLSRRLVAWKNLDDPSPGDLTYGMELQGNPELVIWKGSVKYYRSGLWNGDGFGGSPVYRSNKVFTYDFVWNEEEVYYIYSLKNKSVMSRVVLNQTEGARQRYTWNPETQTWNLFSVLPDDHCDRYGVCGANGECDSSNFPICQCLKAFRPKSPERWDSSDWSQGCMHNKPLNCKRGDKFLRIRSVKTPDTPNSWVNKNKGENEDQNEDLEIEVFELGTISRATDGFSSNNKLGQGGFGPIYKAWKLWKEGRPLELAADFLAETDNLSESEVLRCIHISLLCVQQHPEARPSMSTVVVMLGSENELPLPKEPGFLLQKSPFETDSSSANYGSSSRNEISLSLLDAR